MHCYNILFPLDEKENIGTGDVVIMNIYKYTSRAEWNQASLDNEQTLKYKWKKVH